MINDFFIPTFKVLKKGDYRVSSFVANKLWEMDSSNYQSGSNKVQVQPINFPLVREFKNNLIPLSSSKYNAFNTPDNRYERTILWNSVNHLYYKSFYEDEDYNKWIYRNNLIDRKLFESGSIISISQQNFGERLKPNTITITDNSLSTTQSISLQDDGQFNIIDNSYNTGSFISKDNLILYYSFDEKFFDSYESTIDNRRVLSLNTTMLSPFNPSNGQLYGNPYFRTGVETTGTSSLPIGLALDLDGNTYLRVKNNPNFNLNDSDDFGIGLFIKAPINQSNLNSSINYIISKNREGIVDGIDKNTKLKQRVEKDLFTNIYPYKIGIYNSGSNEGKIVYNRSDGTNTLELISSSSINDGNYHHVFVTKSGSLSSLYIDGVVEASSSLTFQHPINNKSDLFIGSYGVDRQQLSGSIDEVRIYHKETISPQQVFDLQSRDFTSGSMLQTNRVGNVFYDEGIIIISDSRPKYKNIMMGRTGNLDYSGSLYGWNLSFKGTQTIYEHSVICKIREKDFNMTLNPSIRVGDTVESSIPKSFVTGSNWTPYITTIGLYNDDYQLVAIAKLASPIPKRDDIPLNFIVRFDT